MALVPLTCSECRCHSKGATSAIRNPASARPATEPRQASTVRGPRCDHCSSGYFGHPWPEGDPRRSPCQPCQCNNNIDPRDPAACDPHSGRCQRCLHHSHGPGCAHCRPGFHGSALSPGGCRCCSCDPRGTVPSRCRSGAEACFCRQLSGQCPCRPHTLGKDCSRCAPLFWNLGGPWGCEPCSCHVHHSLHPACQPPGHSDRSLGAESATAAADPEHSKLRGNPGLGDVAPSQGALGCGLHSPCASGSAQDPALPLGRRCRCYECGAGGLVWASCAPHPGRGIRHHPPAGSDPVCPPFPGHWRPGAAQSWRCPPSGTADQEGTTRAQDQALDVQGVLTEAGTDARAAGGKADTRRPGGPCTGDGRAPGWDNNGSGCDPSPGAFVWCSCGSQDPLGPESAAGPRGRRAFSTWLRAWARSCRWSVAELQEGTNSLMGTVKDSGERVRRTRAEAQELLKQVQNSWSCLEGLEHRLVQNEQMLGKKVAMLWALEKWAAELLEHLRLWASAHATC
ncbi:laminin subunit beta-2-like [Artibeus jamaicensis]|uniref:laminin subunit beta-2-like n=1 Tax=Artibeus jamaicensis TaxID=9417 RepID=UPI00235AEEE7|nr:laminin subunit beta-2-like [Artibeus jamaicensis]